jgi:hypothetical protein
MKTRILLPFVAGLALTAGLAPRVLANPKTADNVAVTFQDPDNFSDVRESHSQSNSTYYLDQLKECLQQTAARLVPAGQKLTITVIDVDLAGETRFNIPDHIRIMTATTPPRVELKFQLVDAGGKVVREGERRLINLSYQNDLRRAGADEELYYDKQLLKDWVRDEFRAKS